MRPAPWRCDNLHGQISPILRKKGIARVPDRFVRHRAPDSLTSMSISR